ncbi:MAG: hypothetical protein K2X03_12635 [Bryobacteraceae bacterium]|nr:hypothetical protein [Bryobacteraceae bacterium]
MKTNKYLPISSLRVAFLFAAAVTVNAQTIAHQVTLPNSMYWCDDSMIRSLFTEINSLRTDRGLPVLRSDRLGDKVAELRAVQFANYMATHTPNTPGFNPHEGWEATAASVGYNIWSENLAYLSLYPGWIVRSIWQDNLHLAAMLTSQANVAGVSCVMFQGAPYWTYEPGIASGTSTPTPPPAPAPTPAPTPSTPTQPTVTTGALDAEQAKFLSLINAYRAQNGAPALQVSVALQNASQWMSDDMAKRGFGSHTDSLGRSPSTRMAAFGYTYFPNGENIAGGLSDAQGTFDQFKNACDANAAGVCTYAHRLNMLNPAFLVIGIGRTYGPGTVYGWYWATDFGGFVDRTITQAPPANPPTTPTTPTTPTAPTTPPPPPPTAPTGARPVINSFMANPAYILPGQTSVLSWSVTGATSITIDPIGVVTGTTSRTVSPTQYTNYRMTATNAAGTTTDMITLAVANISGPPAAPPPPAGDTQPPTTPAITAASPSGPYQINLTWSTSTDNVGVAGYQVLRNGSLIANASAAARTYTDLSVSPSSTYVYTVRAFDAVSNFSGPSNAVPVTTPAITPVNPPPAPTPTPAPAPPVSGGACPAPATNAYTGCYYNNVELTGNPSLVRTDSVLDFNWGTGSPSPAVTPLNFSARWQGNFTFQAGEYTFATLASDGIRLYLDGVLILDRWRDQPGYRFNIRRTVTAGSHLVTVEYYQRTGLPLIAVSWAKN